MRSSLGPSQRLGTPLPLKTRHYQEWIGACDHEIEQYLKAFESKVDPREGSLPESKNEQEPSDDVSRFDLGSHLHRIFGVDLTRIPGINILTQTLLAEISPDLSRFGSAPAFTSWLGLCPDRRVSVGKVLSVKTRKVKNRAATALRMAAQSLHRSHLRDFNASRASCLLFPTLR
jgi:transposase